MPEEIHVRILHIAEGIASAQEELAAKVRELFGFLHNVNMLTETDMARIDEMGREYGDGQ